MLKYYLIFAALIAAFLTGCTVDTRTTPVTITVNQQKAEEAWDYMMVRRAKMFEELNAATTTEERREEIRRIISSENDLFNIIVNYAAQSGQEFRLDIIEPARGGNVDVSGAVR